MTQTSPHTQRYAQIRSNPRFQELVRRRSRLAWSLTAAVLGGVGGTLRQLRGLAGVIGVLLHCRGELLHAGGSLLQRCGLLLCTRREVNVAADNLPRTLTYRITGIFDLPDDLTQLCLHGLPDRKL